MRIQHDLHTHTLFSSCCTDPEATAEAYVKKAASLGHCVLGISDHLWDENAGKPNSWYKGQSLQYVLAGKRCVPDNTLGVKVLFGAEVEYCGMSDTLGITAEDAKYFDYLLVPHTHTHFRNFTMALPQAFADFSRGIFNRLQKEFPELSEATLKRMAGAVWIDDTYPLLSPQLDFADYVSQFLTDSFESLLSNLMFQEVSKRVPVIIAHPFKPLEPREVALEAVRRIDKDKVWSLCKRAADMNLAFDINLCSYLLSDNGYRNDPVIEVTRIAKEAGVKFTVGTDAHSLKALESIERAEAICQAIGITDCDWSPLVQMP